MTPASRRIFVYWLLLLASALGVGAGGWLLLRKEEAGLVRQAASAESARRAAVAARAGLVTENVELLIGDIEAGLLETLGEVPDRELDSFLRGLGTQ